MTENALEQQQILDLCSQIQEAPSPSGIIKFLQKWADSNGISCTVKKGIVFMHSPATAGLEKHKHIVLHTDMSVDENYRNAAILLTMLQREMKHGAITAVFNTTGNVVDLAGIPSGTLIVDLDHNQKFGNYNNETTGGVVLQIENWIKERPAPKACTTFEISVNAESDSAIKVLAHILWICKITKKIDVYLHTISAPKASSKANATILVAEKHIQEFLDCAKEMAEYVKQEGTAKVKVQELQEGNDLNILDETPMLDLLNALVACPIGDHVEISSCKKENDAFVTEILFFGDEIKCDQIQAVWKMSDAKVEKRERYLPSNSGDTIKIFTWAYNIVTNEAAMKQSKYKFPKIGKWPGYNPKAFEFLPVGTKTTNIISVFKVLLRFIDNMY